MKTCHRGISKIAQSGHTEIYKAQSGHTEVYKAQSGHTEVVYRGPIWSHWSLQGLISLSHFFRFFQVGIFQSFVSLDQKSIHFTNDIFSFGQKKRFFYFYDDRRKIRGRFEAPRGRHWLWQKLQKLFSSWKGMNCRKNKISCLRPKLSDQCDLIWE